MSKTDDLLRMVRKLVAEPTHPAYADAASFTFHADDGLRDQDRCTGAKRAIGRGRYTVTLPKQFADMAPVAGRITPTWAECFEYFRHAVEPPPRRFKFVRVDGRAARNAKWLAGAESGEQRAILVLQ